MHQLKALATFSLLAVLVASVFGLMLVVASPAYAATTFTVDSVRDEEDAVPRDGVCDTDAHPIVTQCTLRAAIEEANATDGTDTINFNIEGGSGVKTIEPTKQLPTITDTVVIDGYSQPGARPNTQEVGTNALIKIELNGASAPGANGLVIEAPKTVVKGLVINRFGSYGVRIASSATPAAIQGNFIGTDPGGTLDRGNYIGVLVSGLYNPIPANTTIGGTAPAARNLISGNDSHGVIIESTSGNKVQGNLIGTDKDGTGDLGNGWDGVVILSASDNLVGGTAAGARNVISGNNRSGVFITFGAATGNKVQGNYIGTKQDGTGDLGNIYGVRIENAPGNFVGGTDAEDGTVDGVVKAGNVISGNNVHGVFITGDSATGNRILGNSIFYNTNLGIELNNDGRTVNDTGDIDTGPNNLQNFPVITSASTSSTTTTIRGTLNSTPNTTFTVQFFRNPAGTDEGKKYIGQKRNVTTDGSGNATFTFRPDRRVSAGQAITATATDPEGNTSEFSDPKTVT